MSTKAKIINPQVEKYFSAEHQTFMAGVRAAMEAMQTEEEADKILLEASKKFSEYWELIKPDEPLVLNEDPWAMLDPQEFGGE